MLDTPYPNVITGPPKPSKIIEANAFTLPQGTERYVVSGCGAVLIPIEQGDHITLKNDEGGQLCEVVAVDKAGKIDASVIDVKTNSNADGLKALLNGNDNSLGGLRLGLEARKIDLAKAGAVGVFGENSPAGDQVEFIVQRDGVVVIAAPGGIMDFEVQDTSTPITIFIKRAQIKSNQRFKLPDPLADPVLDLRIKSQTAEAYFVKAGDFIQILDVDGRQCTDFECFSARKLDKGIEHALDVTTTRTLMGHAYPMPILTQHLRSLM